MRVGKKQAISTAIDAGCEGNPLNFYSWKSLKIEKPVNIFHQWKADRKICSSLPFPVKATARPIALFVVLVLTPLLHIATKPPEGQYARDGVFVFNPTSIFVYDRAFTYAHMLV